MESVEEVLRATYRAFNARDVEAVQVVHDATTDELLSDTHVLHRYLLEDGLILRMDVLDPAAG